MGASLVTGPTAEPVTLAEAKQHLKIDSVDRDAEIAAAIIAGRDYVESQTRRALMSQTWDVTFDWTWPSKGDEYRMDLPLVPVQSVSSISYIDDAGATQTLAANQYQVVGAGNDALPRIVPAYGVDWPSVRWQPETITVRAVCGYSAVPQALKLAVLFHVQWMLDLSPEAATVRDALLDPYRVVRV